MHAVKLLEKYLEMPFWEGRTLRMGEGDLKTGRTTISVRKCRFKHLGKIGDAELEYDVPTGCYRPYRKVELS